MRRFSALGSASVGIALVLALHACGSSGGSMTNPAPVDGAVTVEDGDIIEPDGAVTKPDTAKPSKVKATEETVTLGTGATRGYVLSVPKTYDASRKYPLVLALHGDGQTASGFRLFLGLDDISGDDAIVAYPDQSLDLFTPYDQNEDQLMLEAIINAVKGKLSIDPAKVWGLGYSKGAFMVNEIACRKPGLLKAIAAHATGAPQEPRGADGYPICPGVVGLPVMTSEGDRDTEIGADYAAQYWASVNACTTNRQPSTPSVCEKYVGCGAGKPVVFCLAPGVSHYPIWADAAQVSWDFFKTL